MLSPVPAADHRVAVACPRRAAARAPSVRRADRARRARTPRRRSHPVDRRPVARCPTRRRGRCTSSPVSCSVSQSWGSSTCATRSNTSGSCSRSHASLVIGERRHRHRADGVGPRAAHPSRATSASACGADSVSFQSLAGRSTRRSSSSTTMPCCWPATLIASTSGPCSSSSDDERVPPRVRVLLAARRHRRGVGTVAGLRTSSPVSASRTSSLHD